MTARDIFNGSTGNRARILILDDATGKPKTGVAYNAAGLSIAYKINTGSEVTITLTSSNWHETGGGKYLVDVADSVYASGNLGALVQFYGALTSSSVYGEQHRVVAYNPLAVAVGANTTTPPTADAVADAVWDEAYSGHTTAGTFGKLMDTLRKSNTVIEGTILASPTPTTTTFTISGADYPTGALEHSVLWLNSGNANEQNSPILTTTNNGDGTLTIVLEEALTVAPIAGDTVLIDPTSHVHAVADIVLGVWSAATSGFSAVAGSMGLVVHAISTMIEFVGGIWRWKASSLTQAPTGGGGSGQYAITLVASSTSGNVRGVVFSIVGTATRVETGTSGQAVVNLDAGTYTLRTTPPSGWESVADSSLVVAADATVTKTLVAVGYTPSNPPGCTVTIPIRSQYTTALSGVEVRLKFIAWDTGATKPATILSPPPVQTSDASGVITVVLYRQAKYTATYTIPGDTVRVVPFTVPNASTYTVVEP